MRKLLKLAIVMIPLALIHLFAQSWIVRTGEFFNWPLYEKQWVKFDFQEKYPAPYLMNSNCRPISSRSDAKGELLFYISDYNVFDKNCNEMPSFSNIVNRNVFQQKLIAPYPGSPEKYCVFYLTHIKTNHFVYGFYIVDMKMRNGLGDVSSNHLDLSEDSFVPNPSNTSIAAAVHSNNADIWIVLTSFYEKRFYALQLTPDGIKQSVWSDFFYPDGINFKDYNIRATIDGKRLAVYYNTFKEPKVKGGIVSVDYSSYITVYDFDKSSGSITNPIEIENENAKLSFAGGAIAPNDLEFSPNGNYLYSFNRKTNLEENKAIVMFNVSYATKQEIQQSKRTIAAISNGRNIQLAPDGRIYLTTETEAISGPQPYLQYYLGAVSNPNLTDGEFNYDKKSVVTHKGEPAFSLPRFIYYRNKPIISANNPLCENDDLQLECLLFGCDEYVWSGPNGFRAEGKSVTIPKISFSFAGRYYVKAKAGDEIFSDSLDITIGTPFTASISGDRTIWEGQKAKLEAHPNKPEYSYRWSNGCKNSIMETDSAGKYKAVITSDQGCSDSAIAEVRIEKTEKAYIVGDDFFCSGDCIVIRAMPKNPELKYEWSNGGTADTALICSGGLYSVTVSNSAGIIGYAEIFIREFEKPKVTITADKTEFCHGNFALLSAETLPTNSVRWSTGETNRKIIASEDGIYAAYVQTAYGCTDSALIKITVYPNPKPKISGAPRFCAGFFATLSADADYAEILWNTGETARQITVSTAGKYWYWAKDENDCEGWSDTVDVFENALPEPAIEGNLEICEGESTTLQTDKDYAEYLWNTGERTRQITVSSPEIYIVEVTDDNGCKGAAEAEVKQIALDISGIEEINFGECRLNKECIITKIIKNNGSKEVIIKSITILGDSAFSFNQPPATNHRLQSGAELPLEIRFTPLEKRDYTAIITIEVSEPCADNYEMAISGTGAGIDGRVIVWLPDTTADVGDKDYCIPLYARLEADEEVESIDYTAHIRFNANAMLTKQPNAGAVSNDERTIILSNRNVKLSRGGGEIGQFCGDILLAGESHIPLYIDKIEWSEAIDTETKDGSLKLNFCQQNIAAIKLFQPTKVEVKPNPASDELDITITSGEMGQFALQIYTIHGSLVESRHWHSAGIQETQFKLDLSKYATGVYQIVLSSPMGRMAEKLIIDN